MSIHSKHVGVHSCNRYGFGIAWARVHRLGQKIMRLGCSWGAASNVICLEGDGDSASADFTIKLQNSSEYYGKQRRHELKYFSLGGGHLNQLMVCIDHQVLCSSPAISLDNRMSKAQICDMHPAWGDALDTGLKWTVLHKDLPKVYPGLCNLIHRARHVVSQTHSPEAIIEPLLEIYCLALEMETSTGIAPNFGAMWKPSSCKASHRMQVTSLSCAPG